MTAIPIYLTLVGGPTVLIEIGDLRLLTDPTFDPPGEYRGKALLTKTHGPALNSAELGPVDAVLLSHDQHSDNLDDSGRAYAMASDLVITTPIGAARLGGKSLGLSRWRTATLASDSGAKFTITATPARHGPPGVEATLGDVSGFVVSDDSKRDLVYITGDTVFYDGILEVATRHDPKVILVFAGAAQARGPFNLTMGNNDVLELAATFAEATIIAVHNSGWAHFTKSPEDLRVAAEAFGLAGRIQMLEPGVRKLIFVDDHGAGKAAGAAAGPCRMRGG